MTTRVKQISFEDFKKRLTEKLQSEIDDDLARSIYNKNKNRELHLTIKFAATTLKQMQKRRAIVVGENKTRFGQKYLVIQLSDDKQLYSLASPDADECMLLDEIEFVGKEKNGILYTSEIRRVGAAKITDLKVFDLSSDQINEEFSLEAGNKFILLLRDLNPVIFEGIDWARYEEVREEVAISEAPTRPIVSNELVNFTLGITLDDGTMLNIYFNNLHIRFVDQILTAEDEKITAMELSDLLQGSDFIIPVYVSKNTTNTGLDGMVRDKINMRAFSMIYVEPQIEILEEESSHEIEIEKKTQKQKMLENKKSLAEQILSYVQKYDTVSVNALMKQFPMKGKDLDRAIMELVEQNLVYMPDAATVSILPADSDETNETQLEKERQEIQELREMVSNNEENDEFW